MFFKHILIVLLIHPFFNLPLAFPFATLYAYRMRDIALVLPGGQVVTAPGGVPTGGIATVAKIVGNSFTILLIAAVILTLIYLILGGLAWIRSGGDKQKLSQARARLTYAIIGLIIALGSFFIINLIGYFFKVNLLQIG
jgi:hypothetical protein